MSHLRMTAQEYNARQVKKSMGRVKNVKKKVIDGITFASTGEARRWQDLCLQQQAGHIRGLCRQVPYPIVIHGIKCFEWFADFVYEERGVMHAISAGFTATTWVKVVEDYKGGKSGYRTEIYKLKKRCVQAEYGFTIKET